MTIFHYQFHLAETGNAFISFPILAHAGVVF